MVLDKWLTGEVIFLSAHTIDQALDDLEEETERIRQFADAGKYWDGYIRLAACISFLNMAGQQEPSKRRDIMERLLAWIQKIKGAADKIVRGIEANAYSIGVSAPFGVSISISYTV